MISHISGKLVSKEIDRIEVATQGGVGYELLIPLSVFERLPEVGDPIRLHTHLVVKEDGWSLYGFSSAFERDVFRRVLLAKGVGPGLALGMLSTLTAPRLVRGIRDKDAGLLQTVPRVGRKKAEQIILDLADKLEDVVGDGEEQQLGGGSTSADDAVRALVSLGYNSGESERAVRAALESGSRSSSTVEIIKKALAIASGGR